MALAVSQREGEVAITAFNHLGTEVIVEDRDNNLVIRVNGEVVWSYYQHYENVGGLIKDPRGSIGGRL